MEELQLELEQHRTEAGRLRAEVESLRRRQRQRGERRRAFTRWTLRRARDLIFGRSLLRDYNRCWVAWSAWSRSRERSPLPEKETRKFIYSLLARVTRPALAILLFALVPPIVSLYQVLLLQAQVSEMQAQGLILDRQSQLLVSQFELQLDARLVLEVMPTSLDDPNILVGLTNASHPVIEIDRLASQMVVVPAEGDLSASSLGSREYSSLTLAKGQNLAVPLEFPSLERTGSSLENCLGAQEDPRIEHLCVLVIRVDYTKVADGEPHQTIDALVLVRMPGEVTDILGDKQEGGILFQPLQRLPLGSRARDAAAMAVRHAESW